MTPLEYSAGLGGWMSLALILLLIQDKPLDPLVLLLLPACVIGLTYVLLQLAWAAFLLLLFVLTSMVQPVILITVCMALLISVTTYTVVDIIHKFHRLEDPLAPYRVEEEDRSSDTE